MTPPTCLSPRDTLSRRRFLQVVAPGAMVSLVVSTTIKSAAGVSITKKLPTDQLTGLTLSEAAAAVRSKQVSPVELTRACLARVDHLNPRLNAFITITAESALAEARAAEAEIRARRWRGPLHGIPIAVKDLIDTAGVRTTAATASFKDRIPQEDAQVVRRLKAAGAVLLGKLNLHECAYGASGLISFYGAVRNPWNEAYMAGGSSSGSAVAVATGMCFGALGTDTGGSIRLPSALCGIVGLKPTYGRVSCRGVIPLAWSLDHVGPMTRTVSDAALMLQAIAGYDPDDTTSQDVPVPEFSSALSKDVSSMRLGLPTAFFADLDPEIKERVDEALKVLSHLTASTREVTLTLDPDNTVQKAEAYAYHANKIAKRPDLYSPALEQSGQELRQRLAPTYLTVLPPKHYTGQSLQVALRQRLSRTEFRQVLDPIAASAAMTNWARELTTGATNDWEKSRELFEALSRHLASGPGGTRTAQEVFTARNNPHDTFCCQEYAKLFVALARAVRVNAFFVHLEKDYTGRVVYHDCGAVFAEGKALLVDPAYVWFGVAHKQFVVLDDVQTIAHHYFQSPQGGKGSWLSRCRLAAKLHPDFAWGQCVLSRASLQAGHTGEAEKALARSFRLEPERWDAYELQGLLAACHGKLDKAVASFQKSLALNPEGAASHFALAHIFLKQGKTKQASEEFHSALEAKLEPDAENDARRHLAQISEGIGGKNLHSETSTIPSVHWR